MDKYPKPVTKQSTLKILSQIDNSFYKFKNKNEKTGFGFFCTIKYQNENILVLITNYELINEKYLANNNNNIDILIKDEIKTIEFGNTKYLNKSYDLSIIEIKQKEIDFVEILDIDNALYEKDSEILFNNESIYIIHCNKQNENCVSYGVINNLNNSYFLLSCNINSNSNGFPIFNLSRNKLIGIYKASSNYYNKGINFKFIIQEFINEYKSSKIESKKMIYNVNNEINIVINIEKEDINKNIYFLDNYEYKDEKRINHFHDNLKELNESNTEIYINNEKYDYKKYFKPKKAGIYNISIKFNINLTNCSYMFYGCENIININFISFNTKYTNSMAYMFYECTNIKNLNLLTFNTKNVKDMSYMFYHCKNLTNLDLSSFDTNNVIDMNNMFNYCKNLQDLSLSSFVFQNNINISYMFFDCWKLNKANLFLHNISKVLNKSNIFSNRWDIKKSILNDFENIDEEIIKESKDKKIKKMKLIF